MTVVRQLENSGTVQEHGTVAISYAVHRRNKALMVFT